MDSVLKDEDLPDNDLDNETVQRQRGRMLRGADYGIVENLESDLGFPMDELFQRAEFLGDRNISVGFKNYSKLGIYSKKQVEESKESIAKAKSLVSYDDEFIKNIVDRANEIIKSGLISKKKTFIPRVKKYYTESEIEILDDFLGETVMVYDVMKANYGDEIRELVDKRNSLKGNFYSGNLTTTINIERITLVDKVEGFKDTKMVGDTEIFLPAKIKEGLEGLAEDIKDYTLASGLDEDFGVKVELLTGFEVDVLLGNRERDNSRYPITKGFIDNLSSENERRNTYVHNDLVEEVNNLYAQIESNFKLELDVLDEGIDLTQIGALTDKYSFEIKGVSSKLGKAFKEIVGTKARGIYFAGPKVGWTSSRPKSKAAIGELTQRIAEFNYKYDKQIRVSVKR